MSRIYAYVATECCRCRDAVLPGHEFPNGRRVSKHGDYTTWEHGKRQTLAIIAGTHPSFHRYKRYDYATALAVAKLKGWV